MRVAEQIRASNVVMNADFSAAQAAEIALRLIDARSVVSHVFLTMVDPAGIIGRVQPLPGVRFVGMDDWEPDATCLRISGTPSL